MQQAQTLSATPSLATAPALKSHPASAASEVQPTPVHVVARQDIEDREMPLF